MIRGFVPLFCLAALVGSCGEVVEGEVEDSTADGRENGGQNDTGTTDAGSDSGGSRDPGVTDAGSGDSEGALGDACRADGTCDDGLVCSSTNGESLCTVEEVCTKNLIYLNRNGETLTSGQIDDAIANTSISFGDAFSPAVLDSMAVFSDDEWSATMAELEVILSQYNVEIVDVDPGDVEHTEIIFTDSESESTVNQTNGTLILTPIYNGCFVSLNPMIVIFARIVKEQSLSLSRITATSLGLAAGLRPMPAGDSVMHALGRNTIVSYPNELEGPCGFSPEVPVSCRCDQEFQNPHQIMQIVYGRVDECPL